MKNSTGNILALPMLVIAMIFFMAGYAKQQKMMMLLSCVLGVIGFVRLFGIRKKKD